MFVVYAVDDSVCHGNDACNHERDLYGRSERNQYIGYTYEEKKDKTKNNTISYVLIDFYIFGWLEQFTYIYELTLAVVKYLPLTTYTFDL